MATGTLSANTCSSYGAPATITGTTTQTVASGNCYQFTLTGTDNVGNNTSITTTVKVDTTAPSAPTDVHLQRAQRQRLLAQHRLDRLLPGRHHRRLHRHRHRRHRHRHRHRHHNYGAIAGSGWRANGTYTYTAASPTGTGSVTATNGAGATGSAASFTAQSDTTAPTGGALTINGQTASPGGTTSYLTSGTTLPITSRTDYGETQTATASGLASSTLTMKTGTLSANTCSSYGAPATITGTTTQTVASGNCYQFTLTGTDNVGNNTSITTTVKVDTTAPSAPTFAFANTTGGVYYQGSGTVVYFNPASGAGSFDITASSTDAETGVGSYTFPIGALMGLNWTMSGAGATRTYSYTSGAATPGAQTVTATNGAGTTGATGTWTTQSDTTAPTGGALNINGTAATPGGSSSYLNSGTTLPITSRTDYNADTGSGLATSILTMATGTLSGNTCSSYGAPATITGTTTQTVASGNCYQFTLTGTDNVGNNTSITTTVKVDTTAPTANATPLTFSSLINAYWDNTPAVHPPGRRLPLHRHRRLHRHRLRHRQLQLRQRDARHTRLHPTRQPGRLLLHLSLRPHRNRRRHRLDHCNKQRRLAHPQPPTTPSSPTPPHPPAATSPSPARSAPRPRSAPTSPPSTQKPPPPPPPACSPVAATR